MPKRQRIRNTYLRELRDKDIFETYSRVIREMSPKSQMDAYAITAKQPAKMFYISSETCSNVLSRMGRGLPLVWSVVSDGNALRKYECLRQMLLKEMEACPENKEAMYTICERLVDSPAPEFFLSVRAIRLVVAREREKKWLKTLRKLERLVQ